MGRMDCQTLLHSVFLLCICCLVGCGATDDDGARYRCYECTYYKHMAVMNPNCELPDPSAIVEENCEVCSERVFMNATMTFIRRQCNRHCVEGQEYTMVYQDQHIKATEFCCHGNLCNIGSGSATLRQVPPLLLSCGALLLLLVTYLQ